MEAFENGGSAPGPARRRRQADLPRCPYRFRAGGDRREFAFLALLVLLGLIASVVIRVLQRAKREADAFAALAMAGLATMFGLQASINLAVNTALIPAKGMTALVHLLWRFLARRDGVCHGAGAGDEPAPSRGGAAGGPGCNDGVR